MNTPHIKIDILVNKKGSADTALPFKEIIFEI